MINKSYIQFRVGKVMAGITGIMFLFYMVSCGSVDTASPSIVSKSKLGSITSLTLSEVREDRITLDWELLKTKEGMTDPDVTYTVYVETNNGEGVFTKDPNTEKVYTLAAENPLTVDETETRAIGVVVEGLAKDTPYRVVVEVRDASGNRGRAEPLAYTASTLTDPNISGLEASNIIDTDVVIITWEPEGEAQFYLIQASEKQLGESEVVDNVLAVVCPPDSLLCEKRDQFAELLGDGKLKYVLRVNQKGKYKSVVVPFNFQNLSEFHVIDEGVVRGFTEEVLARVEDENSVLSRRLQAALDNHAREVQIKVSKAGSPKDLDLTSTGYTISATWGHGIGAEYYYAIITSNDGVNAFTNTIDRYDPSGRFVENGSTIFYDLLPETSYTVAVYSLTVVDGITNLGGSVSSPQHTREAGGVLDTLAPSTVGKLIFSEHADESFKVIWSKPDDAGRGVNNASARLAGYRVRWGTTAEVDEGLADINNPNTLSYTITELTPSTQYYVKVQAKNDNQEGNIYNTGSVKATYTVGKPGMVSTITYSDHTTDGFKVSWDRVTNVGYDSDELPLVGYRLDHRVQGETWRSVPRSDYSATEETLTGLISGTNYQVRVIATNEFSLAGTAGEGGETWTLSVPGLVGGLVVSEPKNGGFKVSWEVPQDTGRTSTGDFAAITGYEVAYVEVMDGVRGAVTSVGHEVLKTEYVFTGLKAKQKYDIYVWAKNENGMGQESQVSGWVPSPPGAVARTSITFSQSASRTIAIKWDAPEAGRAGGGSSKNAPTLYKVEILPEGGQHSLVQDNHPTTNITASGLTPLTTYRAKITAKNDWGSAPASESTSTGTTIAAEATPSSAVGNLKVESFDDTQVVLIWTAPSDLGTTDGITPAEIFNYVVKYKKTADTHSGFTAIDEESKEVQLATAMRDDSTTATVIGLSGNTSYTFLVTAINTGNKTIPTENAATIEQLMAPSAPKKLTRNPTTCKKAGEADLTWDASPGATYYKLYRETHEIGEKITKTFYTDTGLISGRSYTYRVKACSDTNPRCSSDSEPYRFTPLSENNLKTLVEGGEIPVDPDIYDQRTREIINRYRHREGSLRSGSLIAKYLREGATGNGSSYADASGNLKTVLGGITDAAVNKVYLVFLEGGTYPITETINMTNNYVAIVGGVNKCLDFTDTETILDGSGGKGRVIHSRGINDSVLLYGVTITNGSAGSFNGGAVWNKNSNPTFMWVTFTGNKALNGGAVYNEESSPVFIGATFFGNSATKNGGGMYNKDSSPILINTTFLDGMYNDNNGKNGPLVVNSILRGGRSFIKNDEYGTEKFRVYNSAVLTGNLESGVGKTAQFSEGWFSSGTGGGEVIISFDRNISADPQLGALDHYGGSVKTYSIPTTSPVVDKGIHVLLKEGTPYFGIDYGTWYSSPQFTEGTKIQLLSIPYAVEVTKIDVIGSTRTGRPDIGTYEAR